ncbi:hypothetical protein [Rheinheimera sp. MM224]|uniref:hypothetical protein n=1 Tax=Rheinheimera sp. MM224 TaxID=3019969 RepID=UPI0021F914AB|nr:hypothetical protein [Rheinheimera sp. MM224]CAI3801313.1 hypothetical protein JAMGFMIE_02808 [Rheinheimera sp. MM224]
MNKWLLLALMSTSAQAYEPDRDQVLRFEPSPFQNVELNCQRDKDVVPRRSDLLLDHYALLASDNGERMATITVTNGAGGQRMFNQEHLVAIMADCSRIYPLSFELTLGAGQQETFQIYFGRRAQPVLQLISNN